MNLIRGDVKKREFWVVGAVWGGGAQSQLSVKNYHFLSLFPFDAEAFKNCKTQKKLFNLCALPSLGLERDGGKNFTFKSDRLFSCIRGF